MKNMDSKSILACVPNFSEGRDQKVIDMIAASVLSVPDARLLNVDPGYSANRTVFTFAGAPEAVVEAAFKAIKTAVENIDMAGHKGEHPRIGAADVCPLIPVSGISMEDVIKYSNDLAKRVGEELGVPVFLYEESALKKERKNLANIRKGEYEGLENKLTSQDWKPDYGSSSFNAKAGATVIGARKILLAWNINIDTQDVKVAKEIAAEVRESGKLIFENEERKRRNGQLMHLKAIGWYIEDFKKVQVSMNLVDYTKTGMHDVFEAVQKAAEKYNVNITGSELIGMLPLEALKSAGQFFIEKNEKKVSEEDEAALIDEAVHELGLDELSPFIPEQRIIEYAIRRDEKRLHFSADSLRGFGEKVSFPEPIPAGGSVSAYIGLLASALTTKVAEINARQGMQGQEMLHNTIHKMQLLRKELTFLVDEDSEVYEDYIKMRNRVKRGESSENELEYTLKNTVRLPLKIMKVAREIVKSSIPLVKTGKKVLLPDILTAALAASSVVKASYLNIQSNVEHIRDEAFVREKLKKAAFIHDNCDSMIRELKGMSPLQF